MPSCSVENCSGNYSAKGLCHRHYRQFRLYGKVLTNTKADFNEVVDKGSYYELILTDNKNEDVGRAKVDKEDLQKIKDIGRWSLSVKGYVENTSSNIKMHRLIMEAKDGEEVDHRKVGFKNRSDNRKSNLRLANRSQNNSNKAMHPSNTSGYKGVSLHKPTNKWKAQIQVHKRKKYLGLFNSPEEAYKVYKKASRQLHGEFRCLAMKMN